MLRPQLETHKQNVGEALQNFAVDKKERARSMAKGTTCNERVAVDHISTTEALGKTLEAAWISCQLRPLQSTWHTG